MSETFAEMLAALEASEGVVRPTCSFCERAPCVPWIHEARDRQVASFMRMRGETTKPAGPPPWQPSVDPLHDIPGVEEFGTARPR